VTLIVDCRLIKAKQTADLSRMRTFLKYWLPVLIWLGLIFIGSTDLLSAEHTSRFIGPILRWFDPNVSAETIARAQFFVRKAGHVTEYAILAMLLWRALRTVTDAAGKMSIFAVALFFSAAFAASDEFHQSFVASRTSSAHDVLIDISGALIGLTICVAFGSRQVVKENRV
jgi:VanZ family protein